MCCSVSIAQDERARVYRAFELSDSAVRATFSVGLEGGRRESQPVSLETGSAVFPQLDDDYLVSVWD